jgi:GTP-binding protein Era
MPETAHGKTGFRFGLVAVVGRPNVGKSTLVNRILGEKLAIISDKPQTTRNLIRGVFSRDDCQIVLIDTPGIHKAREQINRYMVQKALSTFQESDLILFLVEPAPALGKGDQVIGGLLSEVSTPIFLLVNKIDRVFGEEREEVLGFYRRAFPSMKLFPVSALKGEGVPDLIERIVALLPEGEPHFNPDEFTDQPIRFLCAELIREKVFRFTGEEIPYSVAVEVSSFQERPEDSSAPVYIEANLHVERPSQKGILIGQGGRMLKRIGTAARMEMERLLGVKVVLKLWVKVTRGWKNDPQTLRRLGYR